MAVLISLLGVDPASNFAKTSHTQETSMGAHDLTLRSDSWRCSQLVTVGAYQTLHWKLASPFARLLRLYPFFSLNASIPQITRHPRSETTTKIHCRSTVSSTKVKWRPYHIANQQNPLNSINRPGRPAFGTSRTPVTRVFDRLGRSGPHREARKLEAAVPLQPCLI